MVSLKQIVGTAGEARVDQYLTKLNWLILARNFRTRQGELDRVALDEQSLVFLEVKTRQAQESFLDYPPLRPAQAQRIVKCARYYLWKRGYALESEFDIQEYRFDCVYVCGDRVLDHHKGLLLAELMRRF